MSGFPFPSSSFQTIQLRQHRQSGTEGSSVERGGGAQALTSWSKLRLDRNTELATQLVKPSFYLQMGWDCNWVTAELCVTRGNSTSPTPSLKWQWFIKRVHLLTHRLSPLSCCNRGRKKSRRLSRSFHHFFFLLKFYFFFVPFVGS